MFRSFTQSLLTGLCAAALIIASVATGHAITPPPVGTPAPSANDKNKNAKRTSNAIREIDWDELIPPDARSKFLAGPPPAAHDYLGEGGMAAQQVMDFNVNKELNGQSL